MYRGVLVTLDGLSLSEAVLPVVADLLAGTEVAVTLLSVEETKEAAVRTPLREADTAVGFSGARAIWSNMQALRTYLEVSAAVLRARGIDVRTAVEFGDPAERIIEYASRPEIDLVAMATDSQTGLRSLIFGSVAGRVPHSGCGP